MSNSEICGLLLTTKPQINPDLEDLRDLFSKFGKVHSNTSTISKIIPDFLISNFDCWLIIYRDDRTNELLIIPIDYKNINIQRIKETIRGAAAPYRDKKQDVQGIYRNLIYYAINTKNKKGNIAFDRYVEFKNFQLVFTQFSKIPLEELFQIDSERENDNFIEKEHLVQKINQIRLESLASYFQQESDIGRQEVIEHLDAKFFEENSKLFEAFKHKKQITPKIVEEYDDILDPITKIFLTSSATVEYHAKRGFNEFDYALPGCGLWKAVERELNATLIWLVRRRHKIVDKYSPFSAATSFHKKTKIQIASGNREININEREKNDTTLLFGVMLGQIKFMILSAIEEENEFFEEFQELVRLGHAMNSELTELVSFIEAVSNLRNENAHIKAMSLIRYEELKKLVLRDPNGIHKFSLQKILELKRTIYRIK